MPDPRRYLKPAEQRLLRDVEERAGALPVFRPTWHDVTVLVARMRRLIDLLVDELAAARRSRGTPPAGDE